MPKDFDYVVLDNDKTFETSPGNPIQLDTPKWFNWLADRENNSFRFNADDNSYRARKEYNKVQDIHYWYAVKKVNGRLHKKFIGKSEQVTHDRLCEVAKTITVPPKSKPHTTDIDNQSTHTTHTINTPTLQELVNQVQELANRLDNLESRGEDATVKKPEYLPNEELELKLQELSNELANKDGQLQELTNQVDNLNSKLSELTNELANKDRELQELKAAIPPVSVPNPPSPITNPQSPITAEEISEDENKDFIQIEELQLLTNTYNLLKRQQINTVEDLIAVSEDDLLKIRGFGQKALNEVKDALKRRLGIDFPQSPITNPQSLEAEVSSQEAGENLTAGGDGGECDRNSSNENSITSNERKSPNLDKPKIILQGGFKLAISSKQETVLNLLGLIPHTQKLLTSQFLSETCKDNLVSNKGELETLINKAIDSKGSTIRKTAAVLRGAGFVLSGSEGDGYIISDVR